MPKYLIHRINKISEIRNFSLKDGFECDVINYKNKLVMQHDINKKGDLFQKFQSQINKNQIVFLNVKSSGIIKKILKFTLNKNIFFLDLTFSEIDFLIRKKLSKFIVLRYSIYENFNLDSKYFKKIVWIWFDYFQNKKIDYKTYRYIKKHKKKICIVSPELLGKRKAALINYAKYLNKNKIKIDAICTKKKFVKLWKKIYKY